MGMDEAAAYRAVILTFNFALVIFVIAVVSLRSAYTLRVPVGLRLPPSPSGSRLPSGTCKHPGWKAYKPSSRVAIGEKVPQVW